MEQAAHPLPVIMLDGLVHTDQSPVCADPTCYCRRLVLPLFPLGDELIAQQLARKNAVPLATARMLVLALIW